jgi:hypothetical protein
MLVQALGAIHPPPSRYATTEGVFRAKLDKNNHKLLDFSSNATLIKTVILPKVKQSHSI